MNAMGVAQMPCISTKCELNDIVKRNYQSLMISKPKFEVDLRSWLEVEQLRSRKVSVQVEQKNKTAVAQEHSFRAVAIAAGIEAYYRSALNTMVNAKLIGGKRGDFFPKMHIQVPTRIVYVAGFKELRKYFDSKIDPENSSAGLRLATVVAPGIVVTPIVSILEASNAGHMNKENLWTKRWTRGLAPRGGREIIFGIGLNQLSDYFEERLHHSVNNPMMANMLGSLCAGVTAGYASQIPHILSTLKLLEPHKSYGTLYQQFVDGSVPRSVDKVLETSLSPTSRSLARAMFATVFPRGVMIRTVMIVGSFVILNGTINVLQVYS
eukprot:CAMPEP_0194200460 /NCGR_PEP_ID=MMETSP0156-20130528/1053_1 /TAXON_ID=33649 /ORGANISM="Thalassionema nitzschioides, Strain L26-B" /LENGTH=322 /DNA_ID=CAMNT_0038925457 /DNA_START=98 /DNA_END=1066 /DNA_ORIENTATION=+